MRGKLANIFSKKLNSSGKWLPQIQHFSTEATKIFTFNILLLQQKCNKSANQTFTVTSVYSFKRWKFILNDNKWFTHWHINLYSKWFPPCLTDRWCNRSKHKLFELKTNSELCPVKSLCYIYSEIQCMNIYEGIYKIQCR